MVKRIYGTLSNLIADDLKVSKLIFFLLGLSFVAFTIFGANVPIKGIIPHWLLNFIPGLSSIALLVYIFVFPSTAQLRQKLLTVLIYEMNIIGVYTLYATEHMDMYVYQFMVGYVLSTYFFQSKRSLAYFMVLINLAVVATIFTSYAHSSGAFDFYLTYFACQVVFAILYKYRFSTEDRLLDSERQYRLLAENSFDMICVHDVHAKIKFVSPSIKRMLGYEPGSLIGKYPVTIVHPDDEHVMKTLNFKDPALSFMNKPVEFRLRHTSGNYIWFETIFTLLDSTEPDSGFMLSQTRDIHQRKQYQLELEERSKELERSNADLETFAFVSSHDMQEPLRMISNYTQLLKKRYGGKIDKEAEEYIDFANNGAITLQQLLRDLLSYSRITRADVERTPINMNTVMEEVMRNLQLQLREKGARIIYDDLPAIEGDRNLIMLVMQNLVLNGLKYNQSEIPEVKVSCVCHGKEVTFCIEDNGIGIEKRHQQRIFEPFHRLHTRNEYPGTGLGLSICKKIIEKSNGKIWLESEPDRGTKFYFSLS